MSFKDEIDAALSLATADVALAFMAGIVLGVAYMAALWIAVRGLAGAAWPGRQLLVGAAVRLGLLLGGFFLVMDGQWERLLACLAGFLLVRIAVTRWARESSPNAATRIR